jgi:hypothetical protein
MQPNPRRAADGGLWLGVLLVALGMIFLAAIFVPQGFVTSLSQLGWPLLIVIPGITLLVLGLTGSGVQGLCIPGAVLTILGIVLAVQNAFDLYPTWAYAWALIAPGGVGLGMWLQGTVAASPGLRANGLRLMATGALLFLGFGAFFEGLLHISGRDFGVVGQAFLPVVLILFGVLLLARRALQAGPNP